LRLIRWYIDRENIQEALLLMREWLVSRALLAAGAAVGWAAGWLVGAAGAAGAQAARSEAALSATIPPSIERRVVGCVLRTFIYSLTCVSALTSDAGSSNCRRV